MTSSQRITGICVVWNTRGLLQRAYESIRRFHPNMPLIFIDGSTPGDMASIYLDSLPDPRLSVFRTGYNIGHGRGAMMGIKHSMTPYFLLFDSDIEMIKSPLDGMMEMMEPDTYGVGHCQKKGFDGFDYGNYPHHATEPGVKYLHPFFMLCQASQFLKYPPLIHHGSPCVNAMNEIHRSGLSDKILKDYPGLGHSREGQEPCLEYIRHEIKRCGGAGEMRLNAGMPHIEGAWEHPK